MAFLDDVVLDAMSDYIVTNADRHVVVSGTPTTWAQVAGMTLAEKTFAGGDLTKGDGTPDGRQGLINQIDTDNASAAGTPANVVITDDTNQVILARSAFQATPEDTILGEPYRVAAWPVTNRDATT